MQHFRIQIFLALIILGFIFSKAVNAEISIKYMAFLNGQCSSAKFNDENFTEECKKGQATNTSYQNGRVAFGFVSDKPISFSGTKDSQPTPDNYKLDVTQVSTINSGELVVRPAAGACLVEGDIEKNATITCDALVEDKDRYVVVFESTGNADLIYGVGFEPFDINKNIAYAIKEFDRVYSAKGIDGVETYLNACYLSAIQSHRLPAIIKCASIDFAGNFSDMFMVKSTGAVARPYFTEKKTQLRVRLNFSNFGNGSNSDQLEKIIQVTQGLTIKTLTEFVHSQRNLKAQ